MEVILELDESNFDVTFNQILIDQSIVGETSVLTLENNGNDLLQSATSLEDSTKKISG